MTDEQTDVLTVLDEGLGIITLNRPEQLNALTLDMLVAIPAAVNSLVEQGAKAILITGAGRAFCAGAALGASAGGGQTDLGEKVDRFYLPIARALADLPVPVISAINGPAAGAGAAIALSADIIVAARSSYLLLAFANIGLVPDTGATWLVARSAGRVKALEMALLAEKMSAEDAYQCGLITRVVDNEALMPEAIRLARKLTTMPTFALGIIRKQVRAAIDLPFDDTLVLESNNQRTAGFSQDHQEGVRAFKEKRKPVFTGR